MSTLCIGSYASAHEPSVHLVSYDASSASWQLIQSFSGLTNPTFIAYDPQEEMLYAISAFEQSQPASGGIARLYRTNDVWHFHDNIPLVSATFCHIRFDSIHRRLFCSSYHSGLIAVIDCPSSNDTALQLRHLWQHNRTSLLPVQQQSRLHCVTISPDGRYAIACDLGGDALYTYCLSTLSWVHTCPSRSGSGPRHGVFHPQLSSFYVIHELDATITVYAYDPTSGALAPQQTISTLPLHQTNSGNACAEIVISSDGRFLYGSNRGHDSLVAYRIENDGTLVTIQHISALGHHPRHFTFSADERTVFVAHRDSDTVTVFVRNPINGLLMNPHAPPFSVRRPVCVRLIEDVRS